MASRQTLRSIGQATDGEILLSEQDRESHIHILGAPGEGKSKLMELLVRGDIDRGYGCCVLDPSAGGETVYSILRYCIRKGFAKVLLIDPHDIFTFGKVVTINPVAYGAPPNVSVGKLMDTIRVLWGQKAADETPKIGEYLPAILTALHAAGATLYESLYFTERAAYQDEREAILSHLHPRDRARIKLEGAFVLNPHLFNTELASTGRRVQPFLDDVMRIIIGSKKSPVNFQRLIRDKWVILVNLDPTRVWGTEQQRLLGTMVLNEVIDAIDALRAHSWKGRYYVYIDEVGQYATRKLSEVLDHKRKTGLSFTIAHQRFNQIEDIHVLSAVKATTKIKVLFNTPSREDRDAMLRMMYGGDIPDRQVSYELGGLRKQHAAVKINKQPPRITRIRDIPDAKASAQELKDFKAKLYQQPWYRTPAEVLAEINARFRKPTQPEGTPDDQRRGNLEGTGSRKVSDRKAARPASAPRPRRKTGETYFDKKAKKPAGK